jgi:hypothetical protein
MLLTLSRLLHSEEMFYSAKGLPSDSLTLSHDAFHSQHYFIYEILCQTERYLRIAKVHFYYNCCQKRKMTELC